MRRISGFCEACENYSHYLQRRRGLWLCTICRDRKERLESILVPGSQNRFFSRI
ncbi:MAG: hypothetical protein JSV92_01400 [archaeon]|nr:MAG: hypothetical protein JSV92_01400 [archaeon]